MSIDKETKTIIHFETDDGTVIRGVGKKGIRKLQEAVSSLSPKPIITTLRNEHMVETLAQVVVSPDVANRLMAVLQHLAGGK